MKRILTFAMAFALVLAMAVPCFASTYYRTPYKYGEHVLPYIPSAVSSEYAHAIYKRNDGLYVAFATSSMYPIYDMADRYEFYVYAAYAYKPGTYDQWSKITNDDIVYMPSTHEWVYNSWDVMPSGNLADGSILFYTSPVPTPAICDGTSCPANDTNHDNVCDDCGVPLAMSLRSTEYDYAVSLAEDRNSAGYPYYAIFQVGERYVVHVSKSPMTSTDGETLEADGMMYTKTTVNENGTFSLTGWYNGYYAHTDSFVYANHSIANFPLVPPLLEQMEEPITALKTEVARTMMTLALCVVGLMALLVVLALFGKRSLIFRR